jgi:hypothetical protein
MGLRTAFTQHPTAVGQTYFEHLASASRFAGTMIVAGVACMIHAAFPMVFVRTASEAVDELQKHMAQSRRRGGD